MLHLSDVGGGGVPDLVRDLRGLLDRLIDLPRLLTRSEYNTVCLDLDNLMTAGGRTAGYLSVSRALHDWNPPRDMGRRYRDRKGIPVIPGLDDAAYAFDDLWSEAKKWDFDNACSKCATIYALGRAHRALGPEMRLLAELEMLHNEFSSRLHVLPRKLPAAEARFFGYIENARYLRLEQACNAFLTLAAKGPDTPRATMMSRLLRRISAVYAGLKANEVSERLRRI